ncbi:hypothetical protein ACU8KH_02822 [Lachancea thermotolerans]
MSGYSPNYNYGRRNTEVSENSSALQPNFVAKIRVMHPLMINFCSATGYAV